MCLVLLALERHPRWRLVVAGNRDEFLDRPSEPAHWWPDILAGRDLLGGGTWLGLSREGRIAVVTNVREPQRKPPADAPSRGGLVVDFLQGSLSMERLSETGNRYAGFNLVFGTAARLSWYCNRGGSMERIPAGVHGLSNAQLDTPWPKVVKARRMLEAGIPENPEDLLSRLADAEPASDTELPDTGVGLELERVLSPIFVRTARYGTRASTVVYMNDEEAIFVERTDVTRRFDVRFK
ncbi:MAG: NRDE family protein [Candidatus Xenobia bacterium]